MFKTAKFRASVCWGSSQHPFFRESGWSNTRTIYAVDYICCGPVPEPVGPSDFLPSGLTSPSRWLLCRQTSQQSKSRIFIETVSLKPLRGFQKYQIFWDKSRIASPQVGLKRWSPWPSSCICFSWTLPTASSSTHQPSSTSTHLGRLRFILVSYIWAPLDANCN